MKDNIYYLAYELSQIKFFRKIFTLYYLCALKIVTIFLARLGYVKSVYLKGSFTNSSFCPCISDLDFFIIGNKNKKNEKKLEKLFNFLNYIFPMVKDFDFYDKEEASFLLSMGGIKFFDQENWQTIKGTKLTFKYYFFPSKYILDMVNEIYFQFEWLSNNLKIRTTNDKYRTVVIERQYFKIASLLARLNVKGNTSLNFKKNIFKGKSNEFIITEFNRIIENSDVLKKYLIGLQTELPDCDFDKIILQDYYVKNLTIIGSEFIFTGKNHNFSYDNFKLFYLSGCIDTYLIYDRYNVIENIFDKDFLFISYIVRLIEGRENREHGLDFVEKEKKHIKDIVFQINNIRGIQNIYTKAYFGQDVKVLIGKENMNSPLYGKEDIHISYELYKEPSERKVYLGYKTEDVKKFVSGNFILFQLGLALGYGAKNIFLYTSNLHTTLKEIMFLKFKLDSSEIEIITGNLFSRTTLFCAGSWNSLYLNEYYPCSLFDFNFNYLLHYKFNRRVKNTLFLSENLSDKYLSNKNIEIYEVKEQTDKEAQRLFYFNPVLNVLKLIFKRMEEDLNQRESIKDLGKLAYMSENNYEYSDQYYALKDLSLGEETSLIDYYQRKGKWLMLGDAFIDKWDENQIQWKNLGKSTLSISMFELCMNKITEDFILVKYSYFSEERNEFYKLSYLNAFNDYNYYEETKEAGNYVKEIILPNTKNCEFQFFKLYPQEVFQRSGIERKIVIHDIKPLSDKNTKNTYYKKIQNEELSFGQMDKGHYKVVINLNEKIYDNFWVESISNTYKTPRFYWESSCVVLFLSVLEKRNDLFLKSESSNKKITSIDLLILTI